MSEVKAKLDEAEQKAEQLFFAVESQGLIAPGKTEKEVNQEIFELANKMFGIEKYWHKRIVRAGENTLHPYDENPPNLTIQEDDIVFVDFGPIFEEYEADFGRTYVLGSDEQKHTLKRDIEDAWYEAQEWYLQHTYITGAEFYKYLQILAKRLGWEFGGEIGGHLIGKFPHERIEPDKYQLYVHPENHNDMMGKDVNGNKRHWVLEIHFVNREKKIGGFFEQIMC
ncbi:MAG: aminopeptidase [Flammeovirgaceae bacterium]|nr:aminopeptidase [Flammeovirgaceae bacterium]MBR08093.1 aminopeptidase [Rickettsiales bacterium]HCX25214.1 aminopeptidase [Cytophagales bacterium]|tara:strand:- start:1710 stop:2384 length:675 start_codon:yes stop_codon:yes gene_type:complete